MERKNPLVSVIINCYNGEKYLREAIDSVIAQTYSNWEIIFWDNQSTDSSAEIVKSYNDDRIKYYYAPKHTPLGEARNLAMEKAQGQYLSFLDCDDLWMENCLEVYVKFIQEYPQVCLFYSKFKSKSGPLEWYSNKRVKSEVITFERFIRHYDVAMSSVMIKREVLAKHKLIFDNRFSLIEDFDFFIRIASHGEVLSLSDCLLVYRYHENNLSKSDKWVSELDMLCELINSRQQGYESHHKYLSCFYLLRNHYLVYEYVRKHKRFKAFCLIVKTSLCDLSFLRLIMLLIGGVEMSKKYRSIVNRCK